MRKRLLINSVTTFAYQIIYVIYGLILPRLILQAYGSQVNGLILSITQFLSIIALSEFGVTSVVQSSLYKPIAEHDIQGISRILTSSDRFFRKIAGIFIIYIIMLCFIYPQFIRTEFSREYVVQIIVILSINALVEYIFGLSNYQLMTADQHMYIWQISRMLALILSTLLSFVLIYSNAPIQIVKLASAIGFLINPAAAFIYIKIKYPDVNKHEKYDTEPIKQKWNGVAQHISAYVYTSTDIIVLSIFSSLANVSVYVTYNMVLNGLSRICTMLDSAVKPVLGELWVKKEYGSFNKFFSMYEWGMHQISIFVFGCTSVLIVPFIQIYTYGVNDANYISYEFGFLATLACMLQTMKNTYHTVVQSVSAYKTTQRYYVEAAVINIIISVTLVKPLGLIGIAIGTLVAVIYQIGCLSIYLYKDIFRKSIKRLIKLYAEDVIVFVMAQLLCKSICLKSLHYSSWIVFAIWCALIWGLTILAVNLLFSRIKLKELIHLFLRRR